MADLIRCRVLVVEDEPVIAMALEDLLLELGCTVVGPISTVNGAFEAAETEVLDGALLDVNVRGTLIYPVVERLIERGVPVVLCSGYALTSAIPSPFNALPQIAKPYNPYIVRSTIQNAFAGGARLEPKTDFGS
jgi:CheY-like chemotaxis protein